MISTQAPHANAREEFLASLHPHFELRALDAHPNTVYGLLPDLTIGYVNPAWFRFADDNDGGTAVRREWGIGAKYLDAIPPTLRPFYQRLIAECADRGPSLHPVAHSYECSSAERFRMFSMHIYALPRQAGYVVVNSCVVDEPHDPDMCRAEPADREPYEDVHGMVVQCAHCRLVQRAAEPARWDWVAEWVETCPRDTTHGLCPVCFDYYYPAANA